MNIPNVPTQNDILQGMLRASHVASDMYFSESYRAYAESDELITDDFIFHTITSVVLRELKELGVEYTVADDELRNNLIYLNAATILRATLDTERLAARLLALTDTNYAMITTAVQDADDALDMVLSVFRDSYPLNEEIVQLAEQQDLFLSNRSFVDHLAAVIELTEEDRAVVGVTPTNTEEITRYSQASFMIYERFSDALRQLVTLNELSTTVVSTMRQRYIQAVRQNTSDANVDSIIGGRHVGQMYHPTNVHNGDVSINLRLVLAFTMAHVAIEYMSDTLRQFESVYNYTPEMIERSIELLDRMSRIDKPLPDINT